MSGSRRAGPGKIESSAENTGYCLPTDSDRAVPPVRGPPGTLVDATSDSEVSENTSSSTRCPFSQTRYIRQVGCKAHELDPSVQMLSVIGPSTASIISRKVICAAERAS